VAAARAAVALDTAASLPAAVVAAAKAFDSTLVAVGGDPDGGRGGFGGFRPGGPPPPTFVGVNGTLAGILNALETGDLAPTDARQAEYGAAGKDLSKAGTTWRGINGTAGALTTFNAVLVENHLKPVPAATVPVGPTCVGR
jgi:hypothetical protein